MASHGHVSIFLPMHMCRTYTSPAALSISGKHEARSGSNLALNRACCLHAFVFLPFPSQPHAPPAAGSWRPPDALWLDDGRPSVQQPIRNLCVFCDLLSSDFRVRHDMVTGAAHFSLLRLQIYFVLRPTVQRPFKFYISSPSVSGPFASKTTADLLGPRSPSPTLFNTSARTQSITYLVLQNQSPMELIAEQLRCFTHPWPPDNQSSSSD
ncbi:hypothetical protein BXZ70DRAFT_598437 [Cristinia sonorae]|uniref:Uncharacterized protein n=1 Tax=Cristinia sonorae TaxID=1940300 RepID=A0A8K0UVB4_9AGAR|nr:hypothetical protein BXZ70DRAFT_598437 [Cristinia sonorae]